MLQLLMFILVVYMIAIVYVFSFKAEPFNYMEGTPEYIASDEELQKLITHIWYYKHSIRKPVLRHICGDKILGHATLLIRTEDNKYFFTDEQYSAKRKIYLHRVSNPQIFITTTPIFFNGVIYKINKQIIIPTSLKITVQQLLDAYLQQLHIHFYSPAIYNCQTILFKALQQIGLNVDELEYNKKQACQRFLCDFMQFHNWEPYIKIKYKNLL